MSRVLLLGYFGFGNLGDEALLEVAVTQLRRRVPEAEVSVVSAAPEETAARLGVRAVPRTLGVGVLRAIRHCDALVIGPGGIFQDATSARSAVYYAAIARLASLAGKRVYLVGHGIGPLRTWLGRIATRGALARARAVSVRDKASYDLARNLCPSARLVRAADMSLLLEPDTDAARRQCPELFTDSLDERPNIVAVSFRPWGRGGFDADVIARLLVSLEERLSCEFLLLPLGGEGDRRLLEAARRQIHRTPHCPRAALTPGGTLALLARCRAVLGMRLHALVLGALAGCALAGVAYDPKITAFLAELGLAPVATVGEGTPAADTVADKVVRVLGTHDAGRLSQHVGELKVNALRNVDLLVEAAGQVTP